MREDPNYGRAGKPGYEMGRHEVAEESTVSVRDERVWSALSHASVVLWPFTGFLPVAPFLIWLVYKDRSPRVGFHALQSLWYQVAWLVIFMLAGLFATVGGILLTILTFGLALFLLVPLAFRGSRIRADAFRPPTLRRIQSEPGRGLPLPARRGQDRRRPQGDT